MCRLKQPPQLGKAPAAQRAQQDLCAGARLQPGEYHPRPPGCRRGEFPNDRVQAVVQRAASAAPTLAEQAGGTAVAARVRQPAPRARATDPVTVRAGAGQWPDRLALPARARFGTHTPVTAGTDWAQRPVGMHRARLTAHGAIAHWPWPARAAHWHACRELARPLTAAGGAGGDRPLPAVSAQARVIGVAAPPDDGAQLAAALAEPPRRLVTPPANRPGVADMVHRPKLPAARAGPGWRAVAARADRPGVSARRHPGPGPAPRAVAEPVRVGVVTAEANRPGR